MPPSNRELLLDQATGAGAALNALPATRLDSLLADAPVVAKDQLAGEVEDRADAHLIIRTIAAIAARALHEQDGARFSTAVDALAEVWRTGDPRAMYPSRTPDFEASLWEQIVIELYAFGGVALLHERYAEARLLAAHEPDPDGHHESWLRQGQVAGSRAATYNENVLNLGARRLQELERDLSEESALQALAQFDLVSALVISERAKDGFYTNAAEFGAELIEDLVVAQLRDRNTPLRQHVFPGDDPGVRDALARYDSMARLQAALSRRHGASWAWRGFADARTLIFINKGDKLEDWEGGGGWT